MYTYLGPMIYFVIKQANNAMRSSALGESVEKHAKKCDMILILIW